MTATRDAGDAPPEAASVAEPIVPAPAPAARARSRWALRAAALAGAVGVICGLALPFAPVVVSTPTLAWPRDQARVESTLLPLTAHRPLGLDVRFGCDTVRRAAALRDTGDGRGSGTMLATALPGSGQAAAALVVTGVADRVQVRVRGVVVVDEPVPAGACTYRLVGTDAGLPLDVRGPPTPLGGIDPAVPIERVPSDPGAVAGPASARVVAERDGVEVGRWEGERLPDVDVLLSSLTSVDTGAAGGLAVSLRVDDESTTSPAPAKTVLTVILGLALLATVVLLVVADRGERRAVTAFPRRAVTAFPRLAVTAVPRRAVTAVPRRAGARRPGLGWPRRPGPAALVDLAVVAVLALWTFVAPATDDDGYFSLQSRNAALTGTVGDYVQFQNRSFTPFTWPYQALAEWQQWMGTAPVLLRIPAAVCGLLTWVAVRALIRPVAGRPGLDRPSVDRASVDRASVGRVSVGRAAAAVAFLAWWLPYDMGVRPEPVVALCATAAAALLLLAAARRRLAVAGWPWPSRGQAPSPTPAGSCCSACWWRACRSWSRCCATSPVPQARACAFRCPCCAASPARRRWRRRCSSGSPTARCATSCAGRP